MKQLPPTLRHDYRYIKFEINSEQELEIGEVVDSIWDAALNYMGEKNAGRANIWVIGNQFNQEKQQGVIKVRREYEDDLRAALTLIEKVNSQKCFFQTVKVSGAIKNLKDS
ncbi:MAG: Rpp14/Pop5 family protein [Candidatus Nanohaloarchaea archaeon]